MLWLAQPAQTSASRPDNSKDLHERNTALQNRNTALQSQTYLDTGARVTAEPPVQSCASSAQGPHIDVQEKCATGVQQKQTALPPDLAAVLAALKLHWLSTGLPTAFLPATRVGSFSGSYRTAFRPKCSCRRSKVAATAYALTCEFVGEARLVCSSASRKNRTLCILRRRRTATRAKERSKSLSTVAVNRRCQPSMSTVG